VGYKVHAVVWDQAERDTKCPKSTAAYPCLQRYLISSWQQRFNSQFAFVGVQLAGYTAALNNGTGSYPNLSVTADMVYEMRLQQERGCEGVSTPCAVVPTYDLSCSAGEDGGCPYGSVHQPDKPDIGRRVSLQIHKFLLPKSAPAVVEGPRAVKAVATQSGSSGSYDVVVTIEGGAAGQGLSLVPTRNCTACCSQPHTVDFDITADGTTYKNVTGVKLTSSGLSFSVTLPGSPQMLRHTHASIWPQCAVHNKDGLPLFPFALPVSDASGH